jgi:peroxiredoxin Q/BCP
MTYLKIGDKAPAFEGLNQKGETVRLSDFLGKKLALFFYPASDTPSCTKEACSLRDGYADLQAKGIAVLGVSPDTVKKQGRFVQKYHFQYDLIADEGMKILEAYGVWGKKKLFGISYIGVLRTTFLIDEQGYIEQIFDQVITKDHAGQILETL